jgi:hypothetical protein
METQNKIQNVTIQELAGNLAAFAIDRTELKELMAAIPEENHLNMTTIEYELQILKILSVGWALAFFMPASDRNKEPLTQIFWENIRDISDKISTMTRTTSGQEIDYFNILKQRLDTYLKVMQNIGDDAANPAAVMGPAFASACMCENDAIAVLTGTKMFTLTLGAVKEYLNAVKIDEVKLN